ncbi:undecaprenyldiphospho-muramoylpentapeptide beta-N-acetylglucosaminyltransferase [Allobranchiibius huperziae]|uniref:UDP-N-acetylglucosamine--N-acetylmuramyl-(pentapeptide) pyrophosphoryl-undecaprenol N-acetylglucosamine transferase n=1 Tax=Allobranchiibius huperziae TaxID=1874116 RepID=A0A853DK36_9MICO|nr:undecaprenyldiphospho-muramoylpentapeptide beta-N-acetylglucosaminyltransferase [Allobranchiibius huperziae]NYJ75111.1 UDP-N-acetylglucosamine--N-acetylmuramyl-(pentapeptide) pyrophosphoryl-undecaprenol N-acetylglucosamine transferase [Allobranchiibius huperziae]
MSGGQSPQSAPLRSVLLAGGGTAGHISPLLATAQELAARHPQARITVLGSEGGLEERLVPEAGLELRLIPKVAFPRRPNSAAVRFPVALRGAIAEAGAVVDDVDPQVVVGFGGFVSPPAFFAAKRRGIPMVVHEQNARPGLANRAGARLTPYVATTFRTTQLPHARVIGMPLRTQISRLDRSVGREAARAFFGLRPDLPTVLVTGGSLGAARLNSTFAQRARELSAAGIQVLHVTGRGKEIDLPAVLGGAPYVVLPYVDRMDLAYTAADLAVTRSGAGMVCELATVGLPAVFVPLPVGNGEQKLNAAEMVAAGGAQLVPDEYFTPEWVDAHLIPLLRDEARLQEMAIAARGSGHGESAGTLVTMIEHAATGS